MVNVLKLDRRLDTTAADELWTALVAARGADMTLGAAEVELIGARCIEVVLKARHIWKQDGHRFVVEDVSEAMTENLGRFGIRAAELSVDGTA